MAWNTRKNLPYHDHDLGPMNAWKSTTCERCKINRSETGVEIHTCEHLGAFGRRDMNCPRCIQISEGVNVKTALGTALKRAEAQKIADRMASEDHAKNCKRCRDPHAVCTWGQW